MENRQKHFNYQKSQGIEQHNKRKKKQTCSYYHQKYMPISGKEKFLKYVEAMEVGLFFTCAV